MRPKQIRKPRLFKLSKKKKKTNEQERLESKIQHPHNEAFLINWLLFQGAELSNNFIISNAQKARCLN